MSISFRRIKTKWSSTELIRNQKIALSGQKIARVQGVLLLTVVLFSLVYLVSVNTLATKGYTIKELERKIAGQKKENERWGLEIIERQSMISIQQKIVHLGLVPADHIQYVTPTAAVATLDTLSAR